ncbi:hypothetical protein ABIC83_002876 [Roseateles asaccharophilus]|uniref:hypothetical protein n=1 Tax=Roseateles asaccharophilus TaxID=582607 RepID=UPI0038356603
MSLYQCQNCGCCENTALACQGCDGYAETFFDWSGLEDRRGKKLCSACAPTKHADGTPSELGVWHGVFARVFLPLGMFETNREGNLAHIETGDTDYRKYALPSPQHR